MTDNRIDDELEDRTTELYDRDHLLGIELPDQPAARAHQAAHDATLLTQRAIEHYRLVDL
jgi:hypothetical protein